MAIIKAVSARSDVGRAIKYVTDKEKTDERLVSGIDCNSQTAINEMKATKEMWGKKDGRAYYHFVQSFSPEEKITSAEAHQIAQELAEQRFKGYEVVIVTHKDKEHVHTHFIVNSVNHEDGYKLHWSKYELQRMKDMSDNLCREHGKSICQKNQEITTNSKEKYKALERGLKENYKSYVLDCFTAVKEVKNKAISREDFISQMKEKGFKTNWSDSRKYITFTDREGNRVRNSNLEKTFKESFEKRELEQSFLSNRSKQATNEFLISRCERRTQNKINNNELPKINQEAIDVLDSVAFSLFENKVEQLERQGMTEHETKENLIKKMGEEAYRRWKLRGGNYGR